MDKHDHSTLLTLSVMWPKMEESDNQILALLETTREDNLWLSKEYAELRKKHPDHFIVVRNKAILTIAKEIEDVVKYLEDNQIDPTTVIVDFVPEKEINLIL